MRFKTTRRQFNPSSGHVLKTAGWKTGKSGRTSRTAAGNAKLLRAAVFECMYCHPQHCRDRSVSLKDREVNKEERRRCRESAFCSSRCGWPPETAGWLDKLPRRLTINGD